MIKKLIYIVGQLKYNKKINLEYNKLKESEMYSLKKLENIQVEKLQELLEFAFENSQYYKEKFSAHGIETVQINDLSDLSNFPFLNKEELRNNSRAIQVEKYKNEKYYYSETSGSTGEPLVFYRNQTWDAVSCPFRRFTILKSPIIFLSITTVEHPIIVFFSNFL